MYRYIFILLAAILPVEGLLAADYSKDHVAVKGLDLKRRGEAVDIDMAISYDRLVLRNNEQLVVTPLLVSGRDTVALPPVVFRGEVFDIVAERNEMFYDIYTPEADPYDIIVFSRGERRERNHVLHGKRNRLMVQDDVVRYTGSFLYPVQDGAVMLLRQELEGCGDLDMANTQPIGTLTAPVPARISFLIPVAVESAPRRAKLTAHINFEQDKYVVKPEIARNSSELQKIYDFTNEMLNDDDIEVRRVIVRSYASPEATYNYNAKLSANRAAAVRDNVINKLEANSNMFDTESVPEDWDSLRTWIADSNMSNKNQILDIIDNTPDPDVREQRIKTYDRSAYNMLYSNVYPNLRRTDVEVEYNLKPVTIERGLVLIETDPAKMNMEDMVRVAENYGRGTADYERVMHTTMRYYPYEMVPNNNMAAHSLMKGDTYSAKQYLEKFTDHPQCLNNLGVAAYWDGDIEEAEEYFRRAADMGCEDASFNLAYFDYLGY